MNQDQVEHVAQAIDAEIPFDAETEALLELVGEFRTLQIHVHRDGYEELLSDYRRTRAKLALCRCPAGNGSHHGI